MDELKNFIKNIENGNLQDAKKDLEDSILKKMDLRNKKASEETPDFKVEQN